MAPLAHTDAIVRHLAEVTVAHLVRKGRNYASAHNTAKPALNNAEPPHRIGASGG